MKHLIRELAYRLRGKRVFALVGKSGSGKSFRAHLLMEKYNIELLIDDGLLIRDQRIVAGRSAKKEQAYLTAVKTALFADKEHRKQVREAIEDQRYKRVLILGTSERMVAKIAENLKLPLPGRIVNIEEIATTEEIDTAIQYRKSHGSHIIPVPAIEVKRTYPRIVGDSIRIMFRRSVGLFRNHRIYEKTVVRPAFSRRGTITISEAALGQMVLHCVDEYSPGIGIRKLTMKNDKGSYRIKVQLDVPYGAQLSGTLHGLQAYIVDHIERYTGIVIEELNLAIDTISGR